MKSQCKTRRCDYRNFYFTKIAKFRRSESFLLLNMLKNHCHKASENDFSLLGIKYVSSESFGFSGKYALGDFESQAADSIGIFAVRE